MNHLREIITGLADADVDFVIAGGVACVLHGVERFTLDLDVSVGLVPDNLDRFIAVRTASASKLLELKQAIDPPRDKDQADIVFLQRVLGNG